VSPSPSPRLASLSGEFKSSKVLPDGSGGGGLVAASFGKGGTGAEGGFCGSIGPGPGILMSMGGSRLLASGTRTAREFALRAGLSVRAFPAAPRINVCDKHKNAIYQLGLDQLTRLHGPLDFCDKYFLMSLYGAKVGLMHLCPCDRSLL